MVDMTNYGFPAIPENERATSPRPWGHNLTPAMQPGEVHSNRNGRNVSRHCRVLAEANFQMAVRAVNASAEAQGLLAALLASPVWVRLMSREQEKLIREVLETLRDVPGGT